MQIFECTHAEGLLYALQMQSLRRELSAGLRPLHETFVALVRMFGSKGRGTRGLEVLAAMEKLKFDIRRAWLVLVGMWVSYTHLFHATMLPPIGTFVNWSIDIFLFLNQRN